MKSIWLYGAGGHAKVIRDILSDCGMSLLCQFDDDLQLVQQSNGAMLPGLLLTVDQTFHVPAEPGVLAVGSNQLRAELAERLHAKFACLIHPSAQVSKSVECGDGTVIFHSAVVQADSKLGQHVIINTAASVDHGAVIDDFVHIGPNATLCGNVHVGRGTLVGAGAVIIPGIAIGRWCTVGAGSVVVQDVPDGATVIGNPGRVKES